MKLDEYARRAVGQDQLLAAKMAEFRAMLNIGGKDAIQRVRDDVHSIIDAQLDCWAEFHEAAKRGDFPNA